MIQCAWCRKSITKSKGHINRSLAKEASLYCDLKCAGMARRKNKSDTEKKEAKRLYDMEYRAKNLESIKAKKKIWFKGYYDPAKAAIERKANMPRHVEYCRQPKYKDYKREYDEAYRAKKDFGEFWESAVLVNKINGEVLTRATRFEIKQTNGTINKAQSRRREYERLNSQKSEI